jgi:hypothetical protein
MFPENEEIRKLLSDWLKNENNAISGNNFKEMIDKVHEVYNTWIIENSQENNTKFKLKQII